MKLLVVSLPGLSLDLIRQSSSESLTWLYGAGRCFELDSMGLEPSLVRMAVESGRDPRVAGRRASHWRRSGSYAIDRTSHLDFAKGFVDVASADSAMTAEFAAWTADSDPSEPAMFARIEAFLASAGPGLLYVYDGRLEPRLFGAAANERACEFLVPWSARLAQALEAAGPDVVLALMASHSWTAARKVLAPNVWLIQRGDLTPNSDAGETGRLAPHQIDWVRTNAYVVCDASAGVYFNLLGREPQGRLTASEAADWARGLEMEWRCVEAIEADWTVGGMQLSPGRRPPDGMIRAADRLTAFVEDVGHPNWHWTLQDRPDAPTLCPAPGHVVFLGETLPEFVDEPTARATDLAPTFLTLLGSAPPDEMEGRSLVRQASSARLTFDEKEALRDRLRGLGYIE